MTDDIKLVKTSTHNVGLECSSQFLFTLAMVLVLLLGHSQAQTERSPLRTISGVVLTDQNEVVPNVSVVAEYPSGREETCSSPKFKVHLEGGLKRVCRHEMFSRSQQLLIK